MGISISRCVGAGALAFGVMIAPAAFMSSAGVAYADTEADSDSGKPPSSTSPDSPGPKESRSESAEPTEPDDEAPSTEYESGPITDEPDEEESGGEPDGETDTGSKKPILRTVERTRDRAASSAGLTDQAPDEDEPAGDAAKPEPATATTRLIERRVARTAVAQVTGARSGITTADAPEALSAPTAAAQPAATVARPNLINIVGTLFFNLFDRVVRLFEGPPVVPPGRAVRLARTPLELDCGNGYTVDADWYFPTETEPDKIIYLQHGAFARAGLYSVTAADLAVRNNAIVVAPSITSNFFACDGCALGGDQMHAAVADLFIGDRAALIASALAAGWTAPLPQRFVIAGHSAGGQLAAGAAGYYAVRAPADEVYDLAGVLLLDTTNVGGAIERGVLRLPEDIPVHHIAAAPGVLNSYGEVNSLLAQLRPGFVGVQLVGGTHSDAWRTTNRFGEFLLGIATGFAKPRNIDAVQVLAQGWIADWFDGTHTDSYYGERGEIITVDTAAGPAQAYVIPGPTPQLNFFDRILLTMLRSALIFAPFQGNCAADPAVTPNTAGSLLLGKNSTGDTALSLDGRRQTGQSVWQQCMQWL